MVIFELEWSRKYGINNNAKMLLWLKWNYHHLYFCSVFFFFIFFGEQTTVKEYVYSGASSFMLLRGANLCKKNFTNFHHDCTLIRQEPELYHFYLLCTLHTHTISWGGQHPTLRRITILFLWKYFLTEWMLNKFLLSLLFSDKIRRIRKLNEIKLEPFSPEYHSVSDFEMITHRLF